MSTPRSTPRPGSGSGPGPGPGSAAGRAHTQEPEEKWAEIFTSYPARCVVCSSYLSAGQQVLGRRERGSLGRRGALQIKCGGDGCPDLSASEGEEVEEVEEDGSGGVSSSARQARRRRVSQGRRCIARSC
jgi:hypothetical protein